MATKNPAFPKSSISTSVQAGGSDTACLSKKSGMAQQAKCDHVPPLDVYGDLDGQFRLCNNNNCLAQRKSRGGKKGASAQTQAAWFNRKDGPDKNLIAEPSSNPSNGSSHVKNMGGLCLTADTKSRIGFKTCDNGNPMQNWRFLNVPVPPTTAVTIEKSQPPPVVETPPLVDTPLVETPPLIVETPPPPVINLNGDTLRPPAEQTTSIIAGFSFMYPTYLTEAGNCGGLSVGGNAGKTRAPIAVRFSPFTTAGAMDPKMQESSKMMQGKQGLEALMASGACAVVGGTFNPETGECDAQMCVTDVAPDPAFAQCKSGMSGVVVGTGESFAADMKTCIPHYKFPNVIKQVDDMFAQAFQPSATPPYSPTMEAATGGGCSVM